MTFKKGDQVEIILNGDLMKGKLGTVIGVKNFTIAVMFDEEDERLHDCGFSQDKSKRHRCWWYAPHHLQLVNDIKIYRKGNHVIALGRNGKKGVARCNPEDKFDFEVGAKLALERLFKASLYNGKVVCVDPYINEYYTKGKIYQFKDGMLTNDNGCVVDNGLGKGFHTFDEWNSWSSAYWLEVVE